MMNKEELKSGILNALHGIDPKTATPQQLHQALGETIMEAIAPDWNKSMDAHERSRRACYFSMEFLVGRAVYNNLLVLDVMKEAEAAFAELGVSLADLEVIEDAALGNGGLGRLAACFLDSAATLDLPAGWLWHPLQVRSVQAVLRGRIPEGSAGRLDALRRCLVGAPGRGCCSGGIRGTDRSCRAV